MAQWKSGLLEIERSLVRASSEAQCCVILHTILSLLGLFEHRAIDNTEIVLTETLTISSNKPCLEKNENIVVIQCSFLITHIEYKTDSDMWLPTYFTMPFYIGIIGKLSIMGFGY